MRKREHAQKIAREIAQKLGIEEVYNNTDDIELDKLFSKYVNNQITQKEYLNQATELIKEYKNMWLERLEYES